MLAMLALLQLCLQVNRGVLPEVGDFARIYFQTGFRSIWMSLSGSERLFVLFLFGVAVYTVWLSIFALGRVRNLKKKTAGVEAAASNSVVKNLRNRLRNLRQLHLFTFYLLWLVGLVNLPRAFSILGGYKTIPYGVILNQLTDFFYLYPPVVFSLLLLHCIQWFASARVDRLNQPQ
jgi:hypothetical protein